MPSIHTLRGRHVVIDRRPDQYLCFPDVCAMENGRLICVYNENDQHVGTRRKLLGKLSDDNGRTWSEPYDLCEEGGHCPRAVVLDDGRLLVLDDSGTYTSTDQGRSFDRVLRPGFVHGIPDRPLRVDSETLLTAGHMYRGTASLPVSGQPLVEQMVYRSEDAGASWTPLSVMSHDENLPLCEVSMVLLPGGDILALQRENSYVYEPMYACLSRDRGETWTRPVPVPLIGHRPCMGCTTDGHLLVTYRDVGPDFGTKAWMGTVDELLDTDFQVHGLHSEPERLRFTDKGLQVDCPEGALPVRWALRPMTDPRRARAVFRARIRVDRVEESEESGLGMRLGCWFKLFPDRIEAHPEKNDDEEVEPKSVPVEPGVFHDLCLEYEAGRTLLRVDGEKSLEVEIDADKRMSRPILFGSVKPGKAHAAQYVLGSMSLETHEPGYDRDYLWEWHHSQGMPDQYIQERVLELRNNRSASFGDFGYSGWTELQNGRIFCVYHHCEAEEEEYEPGRTCHIEGTWFEASDFKKK